ncbi:MAG: thiamine-phosphate kinase [Verrucomicrobia bacterium]|jgi:thiamine-monophosphate kinase|nr:thiamine-phosphate kinase [Verrucomicrobiota bacterium]
MNEFELIARLTRSLPTDPSVVLGAGDDCAAVDLGVPDRWVLFKTDAVVEGVHFTSDIDPARVGHKALARCLSDFAAMAGTPTHAVVTVGLPGDSRAEFVEAAYEGLTRLAERYSVAVVGGETTRNPEHVFLSISAIGTVRKDRCVRRSGAEPGDALFVTGALGGSIAGKHLDFEPRLEEAQWLAGSFDVHAMIDLSDGLAGDLQHITRASQVGADLLKSAIPISRAARLLARASANGDTAVAGLPKRPPPAIVAALTDGEDFELLFTVASRDAVPLLDAWKKKFPKLPLGCIGKISAEPGVRLRDEHGIRTLTEHGFVHFA